MHDILLPSSTLRICFSLYLHLITDVAPMHVLFSPLQAQILPRTLFLQEFLGNSRKREELPSSFPSSSSPTPIPTSQFTCANGCVYFPEWLPQSVTDTPPSCTQRCSKALILQLVSKRKQELLKFQIVIAARSIFTGRVSNVTVVNIFNRKI